LEEIEMLNRSLAKWAIMNVFGWGLGLTLGLTITYSWPMKWIPTSHITSVILALSAGGSVSGLLIGLGQWLGWRGQHIRLTSWLAFSAVGSVLAYFATFFTFPLLVTVDFGMGFNIPRLPGQGLIFSLGNLLGGPFTGLLVGFLISLFQSRALKQGMSPLRWIGISTLAAAIGFLVGNFISWMIPSLLIVASLTGLVIGLVSGMILPVLIPALLTPNQNQK